MKNFTLLLLISFLLFSCKKENEGYTNPPNPTPPPPPQSQAPVTRVTIYVGGSLMNITSLSYERHGKGAGGGLSITASNETQKVTAVTAPFYQYNPPWSMMYPMEVSYFTRGDNGSWGDTHPRPVPRGDQVIYDVAGPLTDKVVTGDFKGRFFTRKDAPKDGEITEVYGIFSLVF